MNPHHPLFRAFGAVCLLGLFLLAGGGRVQAQGTAFNYQVQFEDGHTPANGLYDLKFTLYNALTGGAIMAGPLTNLGVTAMGGVATLTLNFGAGVFTGGPLWLELAERTNGVAAFTTLVPRSQILPVPYAVFAGGASNLLGTVATSQLVGSLPAGSLAGALPAGVLPPNLLPLTSNNAVSLTNLHAAAISGTVGFASLPAALTTLGANNNGGALTNLKAAQLIGVVPSAALPGPLTALATNNGAALSNLNAARLTGTVPLAVLSGITTNQLDPATIQALRNPGSGGAPGTNQTPAGMALIPAGSFTIGDSTGDGDVADASPATVYLSGFYIDTQLVGYGLWQSVSAYAIAHGYNFANPGSGLGGNYPVQSVDWYDCLKWCNARSQQAGLVPVYYTDAGLTQVYTNGEVTVYVDWVARGYRLPTEAEWEKAARGGRSNQRFPWGNTISGSQANYVGNTNLSYDLGPNQIPTGVTALGSYPPNGYGLYDMAGNLWQWCWDIYSFSPPPTGSAYAGGIDPRGPALDYAPVVRGGHWNDFATECQCARRNARYATNNWNDNGFRTVLPLGQ